ncbi:MAG: c-type cytochrome [Proteobacteria bacterium]|nr:c-type cytochrome [Pseudomonadota bacterium]
MAAAALLALAAALPPGPARADELERGEALFDLCSQCHGSQGQGSKLALAPAIAGLKQWYAERQLHNFKSGIRGKNPDDVAGLRMHPMSLSLKDDADITAVAAYVASLSASQPASTLEGGDAAKGAALYAVCGACHGPDGNGIQQMNAPRLVHTNDWYLLSALEKYKAGVRGSNPKNANAIMMRGMAAQLADQQAMLDVIAHIETLARR